MCCSSVVGGLAVLWLGPGATGVGVGVQGRGGVLAVLVGWLVGCWLRWLVASVVVVGLVVASVCVVSYWRVGLACVALRSSNWMGGICA